LDGEAKPNGKARRARQDIVRLFRAGLDSRAPRIEALRRLQGVIPFEASFLATADPATQLYTGAVRDGIPAQASPRFVENELPAGLPGPAGAPLTRASAVPSGARAGRRHFRRPAGGGRGRRTGRSFEAHRPGRRAAPPCAASRPRDQPRHGPCLG
jgi:hypothetical protein